MIPKKIHFCWYGRGEYNDAMKKCIDTWRNILPDYEIKKWDESNTPFEKLPFLRLLYRQKKWSFISDYMRLYSIYTEGGIYLDTDIEMLQNFDALLTEESFLGFQTTLDNKYPLNSAVLGAVKNSSFILDCLKATERKQRLFFNAMGGPSVVTTVLYDYGLNSYKKQYLKSVLLLPTEYFYPFPWFKNFTPDCITENTICIHWWEDSWKNKKKGTSYFIENIKQKMQRVPLIFISRLRLALNEEKFYHINNDI